MMQYLFLFLFVSASVVGKEQIEKREEPPSLEVNKTTSEPGGPKTPSFMPTFYRSLVKGNKAHGKAYFQGECKLIKNVIVFCNAQKNKNCL